MKMIAETTHDEIESVGKISRSVSHISEVINANNSSNEEAATASAELSSQAAVLTDLIARFRL